MLWQCWCQSCKSHRIRRSYRRNAMEWLVSLVLLPCRCKSCDQRSFKFRWVLSRENSVEGWGGRSL